MRVKRYIMKGLVVERGGTSTVAEVPQKRCSHQIRSQHAQRAKHSQHVVQVCRDVGNRQVSVAAQGHVRRNSIVLYKRLQARQAPTPVGCISHTTLATPYSRTVLVRNAIFLPLLAWRQHWVQPANLSVGGQQAAEAMAEACATQRNAPACSAWQQSRLRPPG